MPGVLVKYALLMERTQHGRFVSVEDLVARVGKLNRLGLQKILRKPSHVTEPRGRSVFDDGKKKRPTPRTTQLSLFVPSAFGNSGLTKDSK